jgi:hypothetical protein
MSQKTKAKDKRMKTIDMSKEKYIALLTPVDTAKWWFNAGIEFKTQYDKQSKKAKKCQKKKVKK